MDLILVLDISYSICTNDVGYETNCELSDWKKIQKFAEKIINSFEISEDATMVGIVTFAGDAKDVVDISSDKTKIINSLYNVNQMGYATCIGCGVENAIAMFKRVSANREARHPDKMVIFMTDGGNNKPDQRGYVAYCSDYKPVCKKYNTSVCKRYKCKESNPTCLVRSKTECAKYTTTSTCEKYKCSSCRKYSTTKCLRNSTSCLTYKCLKNSTTPVCGHPDCCSYSRGACRNDNYCWWKCSGVKCSKWGYECKSKQCVEYECAEYECENCRSYSKKCQEYKKECTEYACLSYDCKNEVCDEYECSEYELQCASYRNGYDGHFRGVTSILHSPYGLLPQSSTPIVTLAIGVGHEIEEAEVKRVSSSLEGKKLYYTLDNFDQLAGIINELVDTTCTKMTDNLEMCSDECHGLCGCDKKCYCPSCDSGDNCNSISCSTINDGTQSLGCVSKPVTCSSSKACVEMSRDPSVAGCCVEKLKDCSYMGDMCNIVYCDNNTGCYTKKIEANPENACFVGDYCDPLTGWKYKPACPNTSKCFNTICTLEGAYGHKCEDVSLCSSDDLCVNATCDEETGVCTKVNFECPPSENRCEKAECYKGQCYYSVNITRKIECSIKASSSCEEGYCDPDSGECMTRSLLDENPDCGLCDVNPIDCSNAGTACQTFACAVDPYTKQTYCKMTGDSCEPSDDPCITAVCVDDGEGNGTCERSDVICYTDKCHIGICQRDPANSSEHICTYKEKCVSDACYDRSCDAETGECIETPLCEDSPCTRLVTCNIGPDNTKQCVYNPVVCDSDACTYSECDEKTGKCVDYDNSTNCIGDNPCIQYKCNRTSGCYEDPIDCSTDDPCIEDFCIPYGTDNSDDDEDLQQYISVSSGYSENYVCVHRPKCRSEKFCESVKCSATGTCVYTDYNCEDDPRKETLDSCHTLVCDEESSSCKLTLLASAFLDVCGGCVKVYGTNATDNITHAKTACIAGMTVTKFAATIGGAAVAGIVIAAVVVAAVIVATSAFGTKELIKRAKKTSEVFTVNNPLYEGNANESYNPMYAGDD